MSKRTTRRSLVPRWLRHRSLVTVEAVLAVGALKDLATAWLTPHFNAWGKVVFVMAATVGLFGGLILVGQRLAIGGVARTHRVAKVLPIPAAGLLIHAAIFAGLFVVYASLMGLAPWR